MREGYDFVGLWEIGMWDVDGDVTGIGIETVL